MARKTQGSNLLGVALVLSLAFALILTLYLSSRPQNLQNKAAVGPTIATINNNRFQVNGKPFEIRGVGYGGVPIGGGWDNSAASIDFPKIAALGANTVRLYIANLTELSAADTNNLYAIPALNPPTDFSNQTAVDTLTENRKQFVLLAKTHPSTLIYELGNEVFDFQVTDNANRVKLAQWIEMMAKWIHQNDPNHPVMYAESSAQPGLPYLKKYALDLDIYAVNYYEFTGTTKLLSFIDNNMRSAWPGKIYLISEYGSDSFDSRINQEDENAQANREVILAKAVNAVHGQRPAMIGGVLFNFADDWGKKDATTHDPWVSNRGCFSCFDGQASAEYWGIADAAAKGQAGSRVLKQAYYSLQNYWTGLKTTSGGPNPTPTATATLPAITGTATPPAPTQTATLSPIPTPTPSAAPKPAATTAPTPTCKSKGASCTSNSQCCSQICAPGSTGYTCF